MTKKIRLILISFFIIFFLFVAPLIVLYSFGYKFDFEKREIVKTGAIHLKIQSPQKVRIYINNKFKKQTRLFLNSALISNLLPREHKISVKKEGFHPWQKNLKIEEGKVTKAEHIFLIKEEFDLEVFEEKVDSFFFSPDKTKIALLKKDPDKIYFKILNLKENQTKEIPLFGKNQELLKLKWSQQSEKFLIKIKEGNEIKFFLSSSLNIEKPKFDLLGFLTPLTNQISFSPQEQNQIFFLKEKNLYLQDLSENNKLSKILSNLVTYSLSNNEIVWIDDSGFIFRSNIKNLEKKDPLNKTPFLFKENKDYEIITISETIFLKENNRLSFLNKETGDIEEFQNSIKEVKVDPTGNKIVYFTDYEIWFSDLNDVASSSSPDRGKIKKTFLNRFSEKIKDCFWFNPYYLIFTVGDGIKISEIDTRDNINTISLIKFQGDKIFFDNTNKELYLQKERTLYKSESL